MAALMHVVSPLSETERNARIYAGDILVFRGFSAVADFLEVLRSRCRTHLGDDPEHVHARASTTALEQTFEALRASLGQDDQANNAWRGVLKALGADPGSTYGDGVIVRGQTPHTDRAGSRLAPLVAHRDSWGSNVAAQTNWWAPLYSTPPERTLALYPSYFERAIANNSRGWDFRAMVKAYKSGNEAGYPHLPTVSETPSPCDAMPISLVPGDLLCFSGAHLHASVPNTTDVTRLSFETRTVNGVDAKAGRGAPNVDGAAVYTAYQIFKRLEDGQRLGELTPN